MAIFTHPSTVSISDIHKKCLSHHLKPFKGHSSMLSPYDLCYSAYLFSLGEVETAPWVSKWLEATKGITIHKMAVSFLKYYSPTILRIPFMLSYRLNKVNSKVLSLSFLGQILASKD